MAYTKAILDRALAKLSDRRGQVRSEQERRRQEIGRKLPQVLALERELSSTSVLLSRAILSGVDVEEKVELLRKANLSAQQQKAALLTQAGYPADYLEVHPFCPICGDSGYTDKGMCQCLRGLVREAAYKEVSAVADLEGCRFDNFDLGLYSSQPLRPGEPAPRAVMSRTLQLCRDYARQFGPGSPSLFFQGATGLGKTHLSLAITGQVVEQGYYVIYTPVQNLMDRLEKEHFGRTSGDQDTMQLAQECDLLVLDDLGSEFSTSFSVSALYTILNTRMNERHPTIISSNLTVPEIQAKYADRIVSRLLGGCNTVPFLGSDVRTRPK